MRALLLLTLAACAPSRQSHTLRLEVTTPEGDRRSAAISGPTNWDLDSLGVPFASWPHAAELGADTELGLMTDLFAFQPGTYPSSFTTLYVDGVPYSAQGAVTVHVDRYRFTGSPAFPWELEGTLEGAIEGYTLEGAWTTSTANCTDRVVHGYGCGYNHPSAEMTAQVWEADGFGGGPAPCPADLVDRWVDGTTVTIDKDHASVGDAEPIDCVVTYKNAYTGVCGADDPRVEADGRTWSVAVVAWPGSSYAGFNPQFAVLGGTVDEGEPRLCASVPQAWTPVSGT